MKNFQWSQDAEMSIGQFQQSNEERKKSADRKYTSQFYSTIRLSGHYYLIRVQTGKRQYMDAAQALLLAERARLFRLAGKKKKEARQSVLKAKAKRFNRSHPHVLFKTSLKPAQSKLFQCGRFIPSNLLNLNTIKLCDSITCFIWSRSTFLPSSALDYRKTHGGILKAGT